MRRLPIKKADIDWINGLAFSPDGRTLVGAAGKWTKKVILWEVARYRARRSRYETLH